MYFLFSNLQNVADRPEAKVRPYFNHYGPQAQIMQKDGTIVPSHELPFSLRYFYEGLVQNLCGDYDVEMRYDQKKYEQAREIFSEINGGTRYWEDHIIQYLALGHEIVVNDYEQVKGIQRLTAADLDANFMKSFTEASPKKQIYRLNQLHEFSNCEHDVFNTDGFIQQCFFGDIIFG